MALKRRYGGKPCGETQLPFHSGVVMDQLTGCGDGGFESCGQGPSPIECFATLFRHSRKMLTSRPALVEFGLEAGGRSMF